MVKRVLAGIAVAVVLAGCGSSGSTPSAGPAGASQVSGSPTAALPWPSMAEPSPTPEGSAGASALASPTGSTPSARPSAAAPQWELAGSVDIGSREAGTALNGGVMLANGDVLLVGSDGRKAAVRNARTGVWRVVPGLPADRTAFGFIALPDGSALVVGGTNAQGVSYSSVYRYDPSASTWQRLGVLNWARTSPGVAILRDGRVLVAGGAYLNGKREGEGSTTVVLAGYRSHAVEPAALADVDVPQPVSVPYASVEILDPAAGRSEMVSPLGCARAHPGVATLSDGRIMFADLAKSGCGVAEVYDPATGSFTGTGELRPIDTRSLARQGVELWEGDFSSWYEELLLGPVALADGGALLRIDQSQKHGDAVYRSFRYRPDTNSWAQFGPTAAATWAWPSDELRCTKSYSLSGASLVPLADGRLFVVGGSIPCQGGYWFPQLLTTRIFDPSRNAWTSEADLPSPMTVEESLELMDGSVLLVGRLGGGYETDYPLSGLRYVVDTAP